MQLCLAPCNEERQDTLSASLGTEPELSAFRHKDGVGNDLSSGGVERK